MNWFISAHCPLADCKRLGMVRLSRTWLLCFSESIKVKEVIQDLRSQHHSISLYYLKHLKYI